MLLMILPVVLVAAGPQQQPPPLDWMVGAWCTAPTELGQDCERWGPMTAGMMLGTTQGVRGGKTVDVEFTRIAVEGGAMVFYASINGAPEVAFREAKRDTASISFENPQHDYPQRVRYWREGDLLRAQISLLNGDNPLDWTYRRAPR